MKIVLYHFFHTLVLKLGFFDYHRLPKRDSYLLHDLFAEAEEEYVVMSVVCVEVVLVAAVVSTQEAV